MLAAYRRITRPVSRISLTTPRHVRDTHMDRQGTITGGCAAWFRAITEAIVKENAPVIEEMPFCFTSLIVDNRSRPQNSVVL